MLYIASRTSAVTTSPGTRLELVERPNLDAAIAEIRRRQGTETFTPILAYEDDGPVARELSDCYGFSWGIGHVLGGGNDNVAATVKAGDEVYVLEAFDPAPETWPRGWPRGRADAQSLKFRVLHGHVVTGN